LLITAGHGSCCAPPPTTGSWLLCLVSWRGNNDVLADQPPDDNTIHRHDLSSRFRSLACTPSDPAISQLEHSILCKYSFSFCADSASSHHASASSLSAHGRGPLPITKRIFLSTDCNRGRVHSIGQALKSTFIIVSPAVAHISCLRPRLLGSLDLYLHLRAYDQQLSTPLLPQTSTDRSSPQSFSQTPAK
jgi:hypothetical protein